jgi:hypothetical protein
VAGDRTFKVGLLVIFAGGPIVYDVQIEDGTLLLVYLSHKISKNGLEVRKPRSRGGCFYKKFSIEQLISYFRTPQKILQYYSVAFRVKR